MPRKNIPERVPPGSKFCHSCQSVHPFSGFYRDPSSPDGLRSQCRDCAKASGSRFCHMTKLIEEVAEEMKPFLAKLKPYEFPIKPMSVPYP